MKRGKFLLTALSMFPISGIAKPYTCDNSDTGRGFKVNAGEARFGRHYRMKGITLNMLDIKISSKDTNGTLGVFEQNGLTPKGGPPLHIHPFQDEFFYIMEDFFKTTDSWTTTPTADIISKTFDDHGMKVVGPPLKLS